MKNLTKKEYLEEIIQGNVMPDYSNLDLCWKNCKYLSLLGQPECKLFFELLREYSDIDMDGYSRCKLCKEYFNFGIATGGLFNEDTIYLDKKNYE